MGSGKKKRQLYKCTCRKPAEKSLSLNDPGQAVNSRFLNMEKDEGTILQRKRRVLKVSKSEVMLILRTYRLHPTNWNSIIDDMKQNLHTLSADVRALYLDATNKQLRERMSTKFGKLLRTPLDNIPDEEIRTEVEHVKEMELRHVHPTIPSTSKAGPSKDARDDLAMALPSSSEDDDTDVWPDEPPAKSVKRSEKASKSGKTYKSGKALTRKRPMMQLIRENQEEYNKLITRKFPKLLRAFGVSSSSASSDCD